MNKPIHMALDIGLGIALLGVLAAVYGLDRNAPKLEPPPTPKGAELAFKVLYGDEPNAPSPPQKSLRLAVTPKVYDDMGTLLNKLGKGYAHQSIGLDVLRSPERTGQFDVIFLTCGSDLTADPDLLEGLRHFVANGGTLYASDLRFDVLAAAFPDVVDPQVRSLGEGAGNQTIVAKVIDPGLRDHLRQDHVSLFFNLGGWKPAAFARNKATIFLDGPFPTPQSGKSVPLMARFSHGRGTVIFTSFHNAAVNSDLVLQLLQYVIFTAVTSQVEAKMAQTMMNEGFAPKASSLIAASSGLSEVKKTYRSKKAGKLRFALGFNADKAKLRLTVKGPDGKIAVAEHTSNFTIEIPQAAVGDWEYTVTAVEVPFPNFPFRVSVGEEK